MTAPDTDTLAGLLDYDAGLLNDWGGGNVEWWQDYLRAEIGRANDFWRDQVTALRAQAAKDKAELSEARRRRDEWRKKAEGYDAVCLALREKVGDPWPPHLSRVMWAGLAAAEKKRADDAEARIERLEAALHPFANYMHQDGGRLDADNLGRPLPDSDGVGWIYLTHGDFRRARTALEDGE